MTREAFRFSPVIEDLPVSIECIATWRNDRVVIGTVAGALIVMGPAPNSKKYVQLFAKKDFSRKSVLQIHVLETAWKNELCGDAALLVSLSSDGLFVHRLPSFELVHDLSAKTRGAYLYALHADPLRPTHVEICVAVRRKLLLFAWQTDGTTPPEQLRELNLPESPTSMVWCSTGNEQFSGDSVAQMLCLGFRKEYSLLNIKTASSRELPIGTGAYPIAVSLSDGEFLVVKDSTGYFFSSSGGKPTRSCAVSWNDPPLSVKYVFPYLVAILPRMVEIRSLETQKLSLVQTLPLDGMTRFASPSHLGSASVHDCFVSSDKTVHRLQAVDLLSQVAALESNGSYDEALALCAVVPGSLLPEASRREKMKHIHGAYAKHLLSRGDFEKAMEHFDLAELYTVQKLGCFEFLHPQSEPLKSALRTALQSIGMREEEWYGSAMKIPNARQRDAKAALVPTLRRARKDWVSERLREREGGRAGGGGQPGVDGGSEHLRRHSVDSWSAAMNATASVIDCALLKCILDTTPNEVDVLLRDPHACLLEECEPLLLSRGRYSEVVTLYHDLGLHAKALQLLGRLGRGEVDENAGVSSDDGLGGDSAFKGPQQTLAYTRQLLMTCRPQDLYAVLPAVLEHISWIIPLAAKDSDIARAILTIFTADRDVAKAGGGLKRMPCLPRREGQRFLRERDPKLYVRFLEEVISSGAEGADEPEFHDDLAEAYLLAVKAEIEGKPPGDEGDITEARHRMIEFLHSSKYYHPERLLSKFPFNTLYEERAILLGRIGRHEQALGILVHWLHAPEKAMAYCQRFHATAGRSGPGTGGTAGSTGGVMWSPRRDSSGAGYDAPDSGAAPDSMGRTDNNDVFLALLRVFLFPQNCPPPPHLKEGHPEADVAKRIPMRNEALTLLRDCHTRVDLIRALDVLPDDLALSDVLPLLETHLRSFTQVRRNNQVVRHMRKTDHLFVMEAAFEAKQKAVVIKQSTLCSVCHRSIGRSAFACYPNGVLVHLNCLKDREVCPVTNQRFRTTSVKPG
eukprot:Rmarinus@m.1100